MDIIYSDHAKKRLRQRGITELEVAHILNYPNYVKKSFENRKMAVGEINNRKVMVVFVEKENFIKVITVL